MDSVWRAFVLPAQLIRPLSHNVATTLRCQLLIADHEQAVGQPLEGGSHCVARHVLATPDSHFDAEAIERLPLLLIRGLRDLADYEMPPLFECLDLGLIISLRVRPLLSQHTLFDAVLDL